MLARTAVLLLSVLVGVAQEPPAKKPVYDEKADASKSVAEALERAGRDDKRVLIQFGANWCGWCVKLHDLFAADREIAKTLRYEYEVVLVDVGRFDKNLDLAAGFGAELKGSGIQYLTVLDADGKPLVNQKTDALESGDHHDPARVKEFLEKYKVPPPDARVVLKDALDRAGREEKRLFLRFGAPWCGWCHKLDDFLARADVRAILEKDYVLLKIDEDRMTGGKDVEKEFRTGATATGGIPWFAILDAKGTPLATADGAKGNIGYPAAPEEIEHFLGMLRGTARKIGAENLAALDAVLRERAKEIEAAR